MNKTNVAATKFPFVRQECLLDDPPGVGTRGLHVSMFGEGLTDEQRTSYVREVASDNRQSQRHGIANLGPDRSPEFLAALLKALEKNSPAATSAILRFARDPRVRPALAEVTRRVALEEVDPFAHVLGSAGGPDALAILRARYAEALRAFQGPSANVNYDHPADRVVTLAQAILRLDPDADDAARFLVGLFDHPRPLNRSSAVRHGIEVYRWDTRTEAMDVLGDGFEALLDADDAMCFLEAAPVLAREHGDAVLARCADLLNENAPVHRSWVTLAVARIPYPFTGSALCLLAKWVWENAAPSHVALDAAALVHEMLPIEKPLALVRDALGSPSPSLRLNAVHYIQHKMREQASHLLQEAIQDEPDPLLERKMRQLLDSSHGAGRA